MLWTVGLTTRLVNIYSHLIGALLFTMLPFFVYYTIFPRYAVASSADAVAFSIFFVGVATCFLLSAIFHIINNHSERGALIGNQLDYLGIVILMWASTIPTVYYGFLGDSELQRLYWTIISLLALGCIVATFNPRFRHPTLRPYRAAMYSGLGFSAVIFITHGILIYDWKTVYQKMSLGWMGLMTALNVIGAMIYVTRIPERWYPKKYDIFGSSHQVLHVMVILAGLAHMLGLLAAFDFSHA